MSYILDALRKADAQRERDPARGIHAQPMTLSVPADSPGVTGRLGMVGVALVVGAVLLAAAMGWMMMDRPPVAVVGAVTAPVTTPPVAAAPARTPSAPSAPSTPAAPAAPATELFPPAPPALPPPLRDAPPAEPRVTAYPPATAYPPPGASDPSRLLVLADLPVDVQRDLPKLSIGGGVYSPTPAQRLLVVNGLVLHEGVEAAPGVLLEQIRPKTAVFNFRGYRYGVPY